LSLNLFFIFSEKLVFSLENNFRENQLLFADFKRSPALLEAFRVTDTLLKRIMTDHDLHQQVYPPTGNNLLVEGPTNTTLATEYNDSLSLADKVRCLLGETSEKYIPRPFVDQVLTDALDGLCRFKEVVRWRFFFR
jgi:hypothetical protein